MCQQRLHICSIHASGYLVHHIRHKGVSKRPVRTAPDVVPMGQELRN